MASWEAGGDRSQFRAEFRGCVVAWLLVSAVVARREGMGAGL